MKVVTEAIPVIKFVPRAYPLITDTLSIEFENEMIITFSWETIKNAVVITLDTTAEMIQRENYSFTIKNGSAIIYKGKIIFLKDNTDVQNYTNQSQDNKRWK